jgi:hypothetical protein
VSEAIHYSGELYNGLSAGNIYVVRFVTCVSLHMVWSATAAARLWSWHDDLSGDEPWYAVAWPMVLAALPSIALHGVYDALLKHSADLSAFFFALLSFVFFFWSVDRQTARERLAA